MTTTKRIALIVLSGGQDSTTCLALAVAALPQFDEIHAISFDYNQRHARELQAARDVAHLMGVTSHEVCAVGPILHGKSPLTDSSQELEQYESYEQMDKTIGDRVELTFVPMRNALFLTLAANRAAVLGAQTIYTGVCQQDNANYPDCRRDFIDSQEQAINLALGYAAGPHWTQLQTPLMYMSKAQSIQKMLALGAFHLLAFSHTAYDGAYPPLGRDHATMLRAQGFKEAGVPDPLMVRAWLEGHVDLGDVPQATAAWGWGGTNLAQLCGAISRCRGVLQHRDAEAVASLEASE